LAACAEQQSPKLKESIKVTHSYILI